MGRLIGQMDWYCSSQSIRQNPENTRFSHADPMNNSCEAAPPRRICRRGVRMFIKRLSSLRWSTTEVADVARNLRRLSIGSPRLLRYPPRPYSVLGMMDETSHGRHSNAVNDAAREAKKLGVDAVLVESHGSSSEPAAAFTNASSPPRDRAQW